VIEALGYPAMVLMGVVLGTIGAGGSILVVPILVYLFGVSPSMATGYSLAIVGTTALAGMVVGTLLNKRLPAPPLRTAFGWFVLVMGSYIVVREVFFG
jgi:uncharacterized membrane protein YfcA